MRNQIVVTLVGFLPTGVAFVTSSGKNGSSVFPWYSRMTPSANWNIFLSSDWISSSSSGMPNARAARMIPAVTATETTAFAEGDYSEIFATANAAGMPVFLFIAGHVELLPPYLQAFPDLRFIIDHCGMPMEVGVTSTVKTPSPISAMAPTVMVAVPALLKSLAFTVDSSMSSSKLTV